MGIMASAVQTSGMFERAALPVGFSSLTSCAASTRARAITKGYIRAIVDVVEIDDSAIRIIGRWRTRQGSNL
jgi:hypothetical protein